MFNKKILVLYAEIMPYNVVTFRALIENYRDYEIHVVSWGKEKKITSYQQPAVERVYYYDQSLLNYAKLLSIYESVDPQLLIVSGRMENDYLKLALRARKDNKNVVGNSDNQYVGSIRQKIAIIFSKYLYQRYFNFVLIPGIYQYEYQRRLGYRKEQILFPQYCADTELFEKNRSTKEKFDKQGILFLGRLDSVKGIDLLISVHKELYLANKIQDKLIIIGDGVLKEKLDLGGRHIEYHTFLSQHVIIDIMASVKYFCLPSRSEPWGVVIHEAAAAALPIVTTNNCGAATAFVKHGYNGYLVEPNNRQALMEILIKMNNKTREEILTMGERSYELSKQIQPLMWAETVVNITK